MKKIKVWEIIKDTWKNVWFSFQTFGLVLSSICVMWVISQIMPFPSWQRSVSTGAITLITLVYMMKLLIKNYDLRKMLRRNKEKEKDD